MSDILDRPSAKAALALLRLHQAVYVATDGRVGHRLLGVPCLLLRTTGRRSGARRTACLLYARDRDDYLVVASLGGSNRPPGWLENTRAEPHVDVQVARRRFPAVATVVERDHPEHTRLWRLVNEHSGGRYDRYQARTPRPIPVVRLAPVAPFPPGSG